MGGIIGNVEFSMELENIKTDLEKIGFLLEKQVNDIECYLFGSILLPNRVPNDVDILVVYKNKKYIKLIKQHFIPLSKIYPLHILYFTFAEEKEFNFINEQKALKIFSLNPVQ